MTTTDRPGRLIRSVVDQGIAELRGDPDRPGGFTLLVDGTAQSHVDLDDPTYLEFEYIRRLGHLIDALDPPGDPLRAIHLGGGAWTLARYVAVTRPGSEQRVIDRDGRLVELVREHLPDPGGIEVSVADARVAVGELVAGSVDLLVLDVFAGARIPAHLTSTEFLRGVRTALDEHGTYAANLGDGGTLGFAREQVATAAAIWPELALVAAPDVLHGRRFGNLVLLAGHQRLPTETLARRVAADPFPARVLTGDSLTQFADGATVRGDRDARRSPQPPPGFLG